jgi:NAD(P)-dependent dehydrogenase (short-subunit alcohol dehydrogenase family)
VASVLITGAARGIGRAIALRLAAAGWETYAGVRKEADGDDLAAASGGTLHPIVLDITDDAQVASLGASLPTTLDALVNNAGIVVGGPIEAVPLSEVRRQFEVNVVGQVAVTQALLPRLRRVQGRIAFVSSVSGRISAPMTGVYSGSKFALEAMADALRMELRPWGMPVTLIEPAQTDTDMWRTAEDMLEDVVGDLSPEMRDLYAGHIEGQRVAIPKSVKAAVPADDVAAVVERALTARRPKARYVVGAGPRVAAGLVPMLPTRVSDALLARMSGVPRRA